MKTSTNIIKKIYCEERPGNDRREQSREKGIIASDISYICSTALLNSFGHRSIFFPCCVFTRFVSTISGQITTTKPHMPV